jgi:hypothetical protein
MPPKHTPPQRLAAIVKINGTLLNAPLVAPWTKLRSHLPAAVQAGIRSIEFVLNPTWKNATYCLWSNKRPAQHERIPVKQLTAQQAALMALAARGPATMPSRPAAAPKRPSAKNDRIKVWLGGELPAPVSGRSRTRA